MERSASARASQAARSPSSRNRCFPQQVDALRRHRRRLAGKVRIALGARRSRRARIGPGVERGRCARVRRRAGAARRSRAASAVVDAFVARSRSRSAAAPTRRPGPRRCARDPRAAARPRCPPPRACGARSRARTADGRRLLPRAAHPHLQQRCGCAVDQRAQRGEIAQPVPPRSLRGPRAPIGGFGGKAGRRPGLTSASRRTAPRCARTAPADAACAMRRSAESSSSRSASTLQHRVGPRSVESAPVFVGALGLALLPQGGVATIERVELLLVQAGQLAGQRQPLRGLAHRCVGRGFLRRADRRFDRDELRLRVRLRLDDRFARLGAVRGVGRRRGGGGRSCTRRREARNLAGRGSGEERAARGYQEEHNRRDAAGVHADDYIRWTHRAPGGRACRHAGRLRTTDPAPCGAFLGLHLPPARLCDETAVPEGIDPRLRRR